MTHLTPDEIVDAIDGELASARHAHLETCAACRSEVERLVGTLDDARRATIPEPSPLFWDHLSRRVSAAIAQEPAGRPWPLWLRWPVLIPLTALGLLILALTTAVPQNPRESERVGPPVPSISNQAGQRESEADAAVDSAWAFILESVGPLDVETARQAGIAVSPGEAERAALHLTDAEQAELVELLQQELTRAGS